MFPPVFLGRDHELAPVALLQSPKPRFFKVGLPMVYSLLVTDRCARNLTFSVPRLETRAQSESHTSRVETSWPSTVHRNRPRLHPLDGTAD